MKRIFLLVTFVSLFTFSAFSQTEKGWRSVGGTGVLGLNFKTPSFNFMLSPEMYWFVKDDVGLGLDFGFGFSSVKSNDSTSFSTLNGYIAPGFRYYFRDVEDAWRPYAFLNAGVETYANNFKSNNITTKSDGTGFLGYAGVGMAWFFNDHAAFDIRLHVIDYTREDVQFNPTFTIGIQAFFHHE
jgi:hypothetical protein